MTNTKIKNINLLPELTIEYRAGYLDEYVNTEGKEKEVFNVVEVSSIPYTEDQLNQLSIQHNKQIVCHECSTTL
jgi:hypothetical protein